MYSANMKSLGFVVVLFFLVLRNGFGFQFEDENCFVTTEQGQIMGSTGVNRKGDRFYSFFSIPYAKPPVGELRFMPPQPAEPWNGILNGTKEPPLCYQRMPNGTDGQFTIQGVEDCLYLNVYTRNPHADNLKPVMVFIHGGGFTEGSSRTDMYGPEFLLTEDIVLVTLNYRLNIFGFLSFDDESLGVTGNAGLKDQTMALKWVNKNIQYFGGNQNLVTIFGESAGSGSVECHTLSPLSRGLFHRAILQSGSALNPWSNGIKSNGKILAQQLGLDTENDRDILAKLKSLPVEQLHLPLDVQITRFRQNAPVVENQINGAFLTDHPRDLLRNGNFARVPIMIGYNSDEGLFKQVVTGIKEIPTSISFSDYVPNDLNPNNDSELTQTVASEIRNFYNSQQYNGDILKMEVDLFTDIHFLHGIYTSLKARLAISRSPVYFYRFSMDSGLNIVKKFNNITAQRPGASHADDLFYLFKTEFTPTIKSGSLEEHCIEKMVKLWTNFAKYGNPTPRGRQNLVEWPMAKRDSVQFLDIGNTFSLGRDSERERVEFWSRLYEKYYKL